MARKMKPYLLKRGGTSWDFERADESSRTAIKRETFKDIEADLKEEEIMGTNYYATKGAKEPCECCGRPWEEERIHIGKSSGGWCFSLHVVPEMGINDWPDWERELASGAWKIEDEYGDPIPLDTLRERVASRNWSEWDEKDFTVGGHYRDEADFHHANQSERGPNGLLRHRIGDHCIKHGAGTWDCIRGEFS